MSVQPAAELRSLAALLAAFPGLAVEDAARLLGRHPQDAAALLAALRRLGWAEPLTLPRTGGPPRRAWFLTAPADDLARAALTPPGSLPSGRRERLLRALRPEIGALVAGYAAALVAAARAAGLDARAWLLPRRRPAGAPWPPEAEAAVLLRGEAGTATLFVAADRRALPADRRAARAGAWVSWYAADPVRREAPVVCLTPGPLEAREFGLAALASADRRGEPPIPLLLAPPAAATRDPLGRRYHPAGSWAPVPLLDRATPWRRPLLPPPALALPDPALSPLPPGPGLLPGPEDGAGARRGFLRDAARLAGLDGLHLEVLALAAFHPPLDAAALAALTGAAPELAARLAAELAARGLILEGPAGFAATPAGTRLAWLREGGTGRPGPEEDGAAPAPREHDALVRAFLLTLGAELRRAGGTLLACREAHRCTITAGPGGLRLVPDGAAELQLDGRAVRWYVEVDRGTEHLAVPDGSPYTEHTLLEKCRRYDAYLRALALEGFPGHELPWVLLVTDSAHREHELWAALRGRPWPALRARLLTTYQERLEAGGILGPVWRTAPLLAAGARTPPPPRLAPGAA